MMNLLALRMELALVNSKYVISSNNVHMERMKPNAQNTSPLMIAPVWKTAFGKVAWMKMV